MNFATEDWRLLTGSDLQLLSTGADLLSSAFERARLFDISEQHRHHVEQELALARKVQTNLLPVKLPKIPGYELASYWKPALEIAGDFYGVFKLPNKRWGLLVADVSDKGASAAMFMAMTYSLIREHVEKEQSPAALLSRINQSLYHQFSDMAFVTAFYAILDTKTNHLAYANAGHNLPVLRKSLGETEKLARGSMALGVLLDTVYEDKDVSLEPGESLTIYSDGVTEGVNTLGEMYGSANLERLIGSAAGGADSLLNALKNDLSNWAGANPQTDDITILTLARDANG